MDAPPGFEPPEVMFPGKSQGWIPEMPRSQLRSVSNSKTRSRRSAQAVRERARDILFQTLRARYWTEEQRTAIEIAPESILNATEGNEPRQQNGTGASNFHRLILVY